MDTLRRAQLEGELDAHTDIESLADFFDSTLAGIRIAAKAGKTRPALKRIAVVASIVFADTKLPLNLFSMTQNPWGATNTRAGWTFSHFPEPPQTWRGY
jgi:hypothetical protein